jgi:hypothetical protein
MVGDGGTRVVAAVVVTCAALVDANEGVEVVD